MKLPNWLKIIWWLLLVGFFTYLLYQRYGFIMSGASTATDIFIFLILIALLVIPLFQEVSIFGVSFKKEIDSLRTDIERQIVNLKSEIQNIIYVYPPTPTPDSELPSIEERIRPVLEQVLREQGIRPVPIPAEPEVPDNARLLFSVRYAIDNELKRIGKWLWAPPEERRYRSTLQIANILSMKGTIAPQIVDTIREVYAICSSAIHGEDVSEASVKFVQNVSPPLLAYLKSIEEEIPPTWKPKE